MTIYNDDANKNPYTFAIQGTGIGPEMELTGKGITIFDGDGTPSASDDTDFGSAAISGGIISHTFTILNKGIDPLVLTDSPKVTISGTDAGDFSVSVQPSSPIIALSGTTTFTVAFDPSAVGLRTASISIANDDADENPYNFSIQGTGAIFPEIDIHGNGTSITDGDMSPSLTDHTDFGNILMADGTVSRTYTIYNTGEGNLTLTGAPNKVSVSGANSSDFMVTVQPSSPIIPDDLTVFTVIFDPSAEGLRTASVSISNDDLNENPYNFSIQGLGTGEVPHVLSITRANSSPTAATSVDFTVTFSESVRGVDASDFSLTTSGVSGTTVSGVSGSGNIYTVTVNTGSGNGTIRLDALNDGSIKDATLNPLGSGFTGGEIYTVIKSATFTDVPSTYWAYSYIERLYIAVITGGCAAMPSLMYCPDSTVTRAQMAVFLLKGMHSSSYVPPAIGASSGFNDVATDYWAAAWIKQLAAEGITGGCGVGIYCPDATVTRAQMAVFLLKAKHGSSYSPPAAIGVFTDVPVGYWADKWIEQLAV